MIYQIGYKYIQSISQLVNWLQPQCQTETFIEVEMLFSQFSLCKGLTKTPVF